MTQSWTALTFMQELSIKMFTMFFMRNAQVGNVYTSMIHVETAKFTESRFGKMWLLCGFLKCFPCEATNMEISWGRGGIELETFLQNILAVLKNKQFANIHPASTERVFESLKVNHDKFVTPQTWYVWLQTVRKADNLKGYGVSHIQGTQCQFILVRAPHHFWFIDLWVKENLKLVKRRQKYQRFLSLQHTPILLRQELFTLWCAIIERNTSVSILQSLPHDQCN